MGCDLTYVFVDLYVYLEKETCKELRAIVLEKGRDHHYQVRVLGFRF